MRAPIAYALTSAKADERTTLLDMLASDPGLVAQRPGQTLMADKNYYGRDLERTLAEAGLQLLRPARKGEPPRAGAGLSRPLRQVIESIKRTFEVRLDLERHDDRTGQPVLGSLTAYDH